MATYRVPIIGSSWTLVASHEAMLSGHISNDKSYIIIIKSSVDTPLDDDYEGHTLTQQGKHFDLSNFTDLYARLLQTGIPEENVTSVTVTPQSSVSSSPGLPYDIYTNDIAQARRIKASSRDSSVDASYNGLLYSFSGSRLLPLGQKLGLNVLAASKTIISSIEIGSDLSYSIYNQHSTGSAGGIINPNNLNLTSLDITPATLEIIDNSTPVGDRLYWTSGETKSSGLIIDENSELSISIENTTTGSVTIKYTIIFEEICARAPYFGLTASTFLEPTTEMSTYG